MCLATSLQIYLYLYLYLGGRSRDGGDVSAGAESLDSLVMGEMEPQESYRRGQGSGESTDIGQGPGFGRALEK